MQAGDKVQWTETRQNGRSVSMTLKEGVIELIQGQIAFVKVGKRSRQVLASLLRMKGQKSQLTEFVELMRESARKAE